MNSRFEEIQNRIGYRFKDPSLLVTALTHSSYRKEHPEECGDNERLEFVGDAVLDCVVGEKLYRLMADQTEGTLTKTRALVVCERSLDIAGRELGVNRAIRFGYGESQTGGAEKPSIIADAMEAVFGAVFLDGGYENARRIILDVLGDTIEHAIKGEIFTDYKSEFQEKVQRKGTTTDIQYVVDSFDGPPHDRTFYVHIELDGKSVGSGTGKSKKSAGQDAAKNALERLKEGKDVF
ncbi:MAG: ribonuclease III [Firmicutes bacterium]|nr:ribonuclease III [Bacillota bacterium]